MILRLALYERRMAIPGGLDVTSGTIAKGRYDDGRRLTLRRWAAPLALLLAGVCASPLRAQSAARTAPPPPPAAPSHPAPPPAAGDDDDTTVSAVTITGERIAPGSVVGDIKPELVLTPADIQSYGVSSVTELLQELSPQTRSDRGRGQEQPVVLLNGRRISSFNEIQNIPTEAILRVDILPEEVGLKYGYTADQKVINIVLRRRFRAITGEVKGGGATEGGEVQGQTEGDLLRLHNDDRINVDLKYQGNSNLTEADRDINGTAAGSPLALGGNVTSPTAGAEIDPGLSALAGKPVTIAAVPASAGAGAPSLGQFVAGAGVPNTTNLAADRTLNPSSQQLTLNGVLAHSVLGGVAITVNGTLGVTQTEGLQGLPGVTLTVPGGDPFSPFSGPVNVSRYVNSFGPLQQTTDGWTGHLGVTANKDHGKWRFSVTGAYDHSDSLTLTQTGVSAAPVQALLNGLSPTLNPFAPLPSNLLTALAESKARGLSDSANAQFLANGPLFRLPAGEFYVSFKTGDTISLFDSRTLRAGAITDANLTRNDFNAQLNLDAPLIKRTFPGIGLIGDFSLNGNFAIDQLSDFGTLLTIGYGLNWQPIKGWTLLVSRTQDHAAPSTQQLDNPVTITPNVRVLDYTTGQTVEVTTLSGGNANLAADYRDVIKVGLTVKPWSSQDLTFTASYIDSHIKNAIASLPAATAAVEMDFPDAFVRNAQGQLVEVNQEPVNFARQNRTELRYGVNFAMPLAAPKPDPKAPPPLPRPRPRADGDGGGSGGGGGGGRGGGGRGGGFGGFGQRSQAGRFQVAVYHTVFFSDQIVAHTGAPPLDLLNGAAAGGSGGQVRHEVEGQLGYLKNGLGLRFSADWKSATKVEGGPLPTSDLTFSDIGTINFRAWDNFGAQPAVVRRWRLLRGTRLTLEVNNLLDTRQSVHDATGATPLSYLPAYLNPEGRVIELSVRKLFF